MECHLMIRIFTILRWASCAIVLTALAWPGYAREPLKVPVIEAGREAEIEALFAGVGQDPMAGWKVGDIRIERSSIAVWFGHVRGGRVQVEFAYPADDPRAAARIDAFELFVKSRSGLDEQEVTSFVEALAASIEKGVKRDFWRKRAVLEPSEDESSEPSAWDWVLSPNGLTVFGWQAGLLALLFLVTLVGIRRRCWRSADGKRALLEMAVVFLLALAVRWFLVPAGPGNFYHHLSDPGNPRLMVNPLGPGHGAWVFLWAWIFGAGDQTVFFAGAFAGAATALAVYVLVWGSTSRRTWGLAASIALALWPVHAWLSPNDDSYGLATCLFLTGMALIVLADKWSSPLLMVAGWLGGLLAATTRPDFGMIVILLGILVFWLPGVRKMQLGIRWLATVFVLGMAAIAVFIMATINRVTFDLPLGLSNLGSIGCLLGIHPGSVLRPPWTPWPLMILALAGLPVALKATRGKAVLWVLAALLTPVVFWDALKGDLISARYQLLLSAVTATFAGMAVAWLWDRSSGRRRLLSAAAAGIAVLAAGWSLVSPPPQPTFRLEYDFFREHIKAVPADCEIVWHHWDPDLGLMPPIYLSSYYDLGHKWVEPSGMADVEEKCVVYWLPAVCATDVHDDQHPAHDCRKIQNSYRLVPLAETHIPARSGHEELYLVDPVKIGFYRLRR